MRILRFKCSNLNSFLSYDLEFNEDVSFLYGINGSGKTTVLRAIASLLTPDPVWLFNTIYDFIGIIVEHEGKITHISAQRDRNFVHITVSGEISASDRFDLDDVRIYRIDDDLYRSSSEYEEHARRTANFVQQTKTFSVIGELPTPIFLGLDRTTLTQAPMLRPGGRPVRNRSVHPYFRTQLDDAIFEAERLLHQQLSSLTLERNKIFQALRNEFVLSLFRIPTDREQIVFDATKKDYSRRSRLMQESVVTALKKIDVSAPQITEVVEPFFREMDRVWSLAAKATPPDPADFQQTAFMEYMEKVSPSINFRPYIAIIEGTLSKIEEANKRDRKVSRPLEEYQAIMNSFFGDSGKQLVFDENKVRIILPTHEAADITSLSSGERQIFVLITHLVCNPAIRGENVLLIDEPELSLHLKWQRQFVGAIRNASPATQMVLATHSPEIIYDLDDKLLYLGNA